MTDNPFATPPAPAAPALEQQRPAWGLIGTIVWGAVAFAVWVMAQLVMVVLIVAWRHSEAAAPIDMEQLARDGFVLALITVVAGPIWIAVTAVASRWRGWRVADYLALQWPRRSELLFAVGCLVALLIAFDLITLAVGREVVPRFMLEAYTTARASGLGAILLLFFAIVVIAPLSEEIVFRGFLYRGLSTSFLGVAGTVLLTSAAWTAMHIQYDWFLLAQVFTLGILFGWLRWATGSTTLTIILHTLANFAASAQTVWKVEWMG